ALIEALQVGDVRLPLLLALETDVEADQMDVMPGDQRRRQVRGRVRDDRGRGHSGFLTCLPMPKTLVTGGTGFVGLQLVRELARRGDDLRVLVRERSNTDLIDGIDFERVSADVTDRDSVRKAMKGVERVFHVAGTTSMRTRARDHVVEVNVGGTRN